MAAKCLLAFTYINVLVWLSWLEATHQYTTMYRAPPNSAGAGGQYIAVKMFVVCREGLTMPKTSYMKTLFSILFEFL